MSDPTSAQPSPDTKHHPFAAPPGGVMTREVGAIRGDLEAWMDPTKPGTVRVQYVGATESYTVKGKAGNRTIDDVVAHLTTDPGVDEDDNPRPTSLT